MDEKLEEKRRKKVDEKKEEIENKQEVDKEQ